MKRILVIGSSGAGKSALSRELGQITGLPVIHLDFHHWLPNWNEPDKTEWARQVDVLISLDRWIMDGNFGGTMEARLRRCDTVVLLDLPRHICVWRIIKRVITYHGDARPDLPPGCPEKFDLQFLKWVWDFPTQTRPKVLERISSVADDVRVFRLRSKREVAEFLNSMRMTYGLSDRN